MKVRWFFISSNWPSCLGAKRLLIVLTVAVILWPQYVSGQQPVVQKLTIGQVQDLVSHGVPDSTMHTEILRRGLAFIPDQGTVESLRSKVRSNRCVRRVLALRP
jgi:hypothetical protein